jgi:N-acetylglucosamine malate deacetylase 1
VKSTLFQWAQRILVISPHADDEVIGCGGTIARAIEGASEVTVVVMSIGGVKHCHLNVIASTDERTSELAACSRRLGVSNWYILFPEKDMRLETIPMIEIVTSLDHILDEGGFEEVYIPLPSHNMDHRITYEAALSSLRPSARRISPTLVAAYEGTVINWRPHELNSGQLYVDISSFIDKKIAALEEYHSQLRPYPHTTSIDAVRRLAAMRGMESGVSYAEKFSILRLVR